MNWRSFRKRMKNRRYRRHFIAVSAFWAVLLILASLSLALLFGEKADAQEETAEVYYKYYQYIQIEKGDTLWGYAEEFRAPDGESIKEYVEEVKSINHMKSDKLVEGKMIVLPYYSTEYVCSKVY